MLSAAPSPAGPAPITTTEYWSGTAWSGTASPGAFGASGPSGIAEAVGQTLEAAEAGLLAEDLHRLEQRRTDPATAHGGPQRAERSARLEALTIDERGPQGGLDVGGDPRVERLERHPRRIEDGDPVRLRQRVILDDDVLIRREEEREHAAHLA